MIETFYTGNHSYDKILIVVTRHIIVALLYCKNARVIKLHGMLMLLVTNTICNLAQL